MAFSLFMKIDDFDINTNASLRQIEIDTFDLVFHFFFFLFWFSSYYSTCSILIKSWNKSIKSCMA